MATRLRNPLLSIAGTGAGPDRTWLLKARPLTLLLALASGAAPGATFLANNFADVSDAAPGNGVCDVGNGTCSFRAAVQEANALAGRDTITLAAGTHVISQQAGPINSGLPVSLSSEIDVVGQGVGASILYSQQTNFINSGIIEVHPSSGEISFTDLSIDLRTGGYGIVYSAFCGGCGMRIENAEILANLTVPPPPPSAPFVLDLTSQGSVTLRNVTMEHRRPGALEFIRNGTSGELLVEDSSFDGGNVSNTFISHNTFFASGRVTLRRTTVRNLVNAYALAAAVRIRNFAGPGQLVTLEDSEFVSVARGLIIDNAGQVQDFSISRSTFANNTVAVAVSGPGTGTILNSTISGGGTGVALIAPSGGGGSVDVTLNNTTISGATTSISNPAVNGSVSARNSIIANAATGCSDTLQSLGYNLIEDPCTLAGDTTGNILATDPQLDALADNGGETATFALLAGSPAIDAADDASCEALDQRGFTRPADGDGNASAVCDMGAFEKNATLIVNLPPQALDDDILSTEDSSTYLDVSLNDSDPDANLDPASANTDCSACTLPAHGALSANGDGSFNYIAEPDYFGPDSFIYEICDTGTLCDSATVSITVRAVNDAPDFIPGAAQVFAGGSSGAQLATGWASGVNFGPNESGQSVVGFSLQTVSDSAGVVIGLPLIDASGTLSYELSGNSGTAEFAVRVQDDGGTDLGGIDTSGPLPLYISVGSTADLGVRVEQCTERVAPGGDYGYALVALHNGPNDALDIVADHVLPAGAVAVAMPPGCTSVPDALACHRARLAAGSRWVLPVTVQVPDTPGASLTGSVQVSSATDDPQSTNNSATFKIELVAGLVLSDSFESCNGAGD